MKVRSHLRRAIRMAAVVLSAVPILALGGCAEPDSGVWQGYVEGDYVYVAAPLGGQLLQRAVSKGDAVTPGQPLFALESDAEAAAVAAAEHEARRAADTLADLEKGGRPSEIAALGAALAEARSARDLAAKELERRKALLATGAIAPEDLDVAGADYERKRQAARRAEAELRTARLGGRTDAVAAARAAADAARARLEQARWNLDQKSQAAPVAAMVTQTLFEPGEYVPAGKPVVELLPPGNVKVRFFVPENVVGTLKVGQAVSVSFDGADKPVAARIDYIAPEAEYTPPVIYSSQSRAKLVFMIEARPADASGPRPPLRPSLHPGQPVDVLPAPPGAGGN